MMMAVGLSSKSSPKSMTIRFELLTPELGMCIYDCAKEVISGHKKMISRDFMTCKIVSSASRNDTFAGFVNGWLHLADGWRRKDTE